MNRKKLFSFDKKLKSKMGWSISELTRNFLRGSGKLNSEYYEHFWQQLQSSEKSYLQIIARTLEKLAIYPSDNLSLSVLCNTLVYLLLVEHILYFDTPTLERLKKLLDSNLAQIDRQTKNLLRSAVNIFDGKDMFAKLINNYFEPTRNISYQKVNKLMIGSDKTFYASYLNTLNLQDRENAEKILFLLCNKIQDFASPDLSQQDIHEKRVFLILDYIRSFISQHAIFPITLVEKLEEALKALYFWPSKVSNEVLRTLHLVESEKKFKGSALLFKFGAESVYSNVIAKVPILKNRKLVKWENLRTSPIYYLAENYSRNLFFLFLMRVTTITVDQFKGEKVLKGLSSRTILLMLIYILNLNGDLTTNDVTNIHWLTKHQVLSYFKRLLDISFILSNSELDDASKKAKLAVLKKEIYGTAMKNLTNPTKNLRPICSIKKFPANFVPELPPLSHLVFTSESKNKGQHKLEDPSSVFTSVWNKYLDTKTLNFRFKFVIFGGKKTINSVIKIYVSLLEKGCENEKMEFYLIPTIKSRLAIYMAMNDEQYLRSVFNIFHRDLLIPSFDLNEKEPAKLKYPNDKIQSPGLFFREMVEKYVREANKTFEFTLCNVYTWENKSDSDCYT
ncbi:hypothetical protein MHBO_001418, partial [Bonamia ostreae]